MSIENIKKYNGMGDRIKKARNKHGMTQTQLADKVGISKQQISNYEKDRSEPKDDTLMRVAFALGTSSEWLTDGSGSEFYIDSYTDRAVLSTSQVSQSLIPIISLVDAQKWPLMDEPGITFKAISAPERTGAGAFAILVSSDSMEPKFMAGDMIVVEPHMEPISMDYVLAKVGEWGDEVILRQYIRESGKTYLKPENMQYGMKEATDITIIGVVTHVIRRVSRR